VKEIARVIGWKGEVVALPSAQLPVSLRRDVFDFSQQYSVDSSRIRKELNYSETLTFDEALHRTIEWERANPLRRSIRKRLTMLMRTLRWQHSIGRAGRPISERILFLAKPPSRLVRSV